MTTVTCRVRAVVDTLALEVVMAKVPWVDADPSVVYAFEKGAQFGMVKALERGPMLPKQVRRTGGPSSDVWTVEEWRVELQKTVDWLKDFDAAKAAKAGK
jgi:hypothetical protein